MLNVTWVGLSVTRGEGRHLEGLKACPGEGQMDRGGAHGWTPTRCQKAWVRPGRTIRWLGCGGGTAVGSRTSAAAAGAGGYRCGAHAKWRTSLTRPGTSNTFAPRVQCWLRTALRPLGILIDTSAPGASAAATALYEQPYSE